MDVKQVHQTIYRSIQHVMGRFRSSFPLLLEALVHYFEGKRDQGGFVSDLAMLKRVGSKLIFYSFFSTPILQFYNSFLSSFCFFLEHFLFFIFKLPLFAFSHTFPHFSSLPSLKSHLSRFTPFCDALRLVLFTSGSGGSGCVSVYHF